MRKKERFNKKLLVEGNDDLHVVCALCEKHTVPETFDVIDCKGIRNVIDEMLFRLKLRVETIGIMIDADTDINVRWQSIQSPDPYLACLAGRSGYTHGTKHYEKVLVYRSGNMRHFYSMVNGFI